MPRRTNQSYSLLPRKTNPINTRPGVDETPVFLSSFLINIPLLKYLLRVDLCGSDRSNIRMIVFEETKKEPKQVATSFSVDRHRHGEDAYPDFTHLLRFVRLTVVSCAVPILRQLADRASFPTSHKLINQSLVTQSYHQFHGHASVTWPEFVNSEITMSFAFAINAYWSDGQSIF